MAVLDFPDNPTTGDTYEKDDVIYTWTAGGYWKSVSKASLYGSSAKAVKNSGSNLIGNAEYSRYFKRMDVDFNTGGIVYADEAIFNTPTLTWFTYVGTTPYTFGAEDPTLDSNWVDIGQGSLREHLLTTAGGSQIVMADGRTLQETIDALP
jgi:hypothetical protein